MAGQGVRWYGRLPPLAFVHHLPLVLNVERTSFVFVQPRRAAGAVGVFEAEAEARRRAGLPCRVVDAEQEPVQMETRRRAPQGEPVRPLWNNDVAIDGDGKPVDAVRGFHPALGELVNRGASATASRSKYGLDMILICTVHFCLHG